MRILSLILVAFSTLLIGLFSDSPHGKDFTVSCSVCHSPSSWKLDKEIYSFNHSTTKMPLVGQHNSIDCRMCHTSLVFSEAKTECNSCHKDVHEATVGPDCNRCHTPNSWLVANITKIHQQSRFPLVGVHSGVDCFQCHKSETFLKFEVLGVECNNCHNDKYLATTTPNHLISGISKQCGDCHSIFAKEWKGSGYNHDFFPLKQGHAIDNCSKCHTTGLFAKMSMECSSCHLPTYNSTSSPNHQAMSFSKVCTDCHTTASGWKPTTFSHSNFPLTQGHSQVDCNKCHTSGKYSALSNDCFTCHQPNYNASTNPNHVTNQFSTTCKQCHTTAPGWKPATFNHINFPLTQGHAVNNCALCHTNNNYKTVINECFACHKPNYISTTNPNHLAAQFTTTCTQCHTTAPGWKPTTYVHPVTFPLTQGHAVNECAKCHTNGNYTNLSKECVICHQTNYNSTTNPNHRTLQFSTTCTQCHSTTPGWKPATFNHTGFPLTLGHAINDCSKCHANGNYAKVSTECVSCHQTTYNTTTNPKHSTLSFSTTCLQCHTTLPGWKPAKYLQHDVIFPIYSGKHKGRWTNCSECHATPSSYKIFSCTDCHEHNKIDMDNKHKGEAKYVYNSVNCLGCHPIGKGK